MFWSCWTNCTSSLKPGFREAWKKAGVKTILGFNEPDNHGQSNLTPEQAALYWFQLHDFAKTFDPPLTLVGPGMTHWTEDGGSPWLDQFFGNLTDDHIRSIKFLAQHDYSGSAKGILAKADALYKKYKKKVWLTEFAVGNGTTRERNDKFMKEILPMLDAAESVDRYAWYSTRNFPSGWVTGSNLLPYFNGSGWQHMSSKTCQADEMHWLSQHGAAAECKALALETDACAEPKTIVYQSGDVKNCYCTNTSTCTLGYSSWQDVYVHQGALPKPWKHTPHKACGAGEMLWVGAHKDIALCQAEVVSNSLCVAAPTKTVLFETGPKHSCYCLNTSTCTSQTSDWLDLYEEPALVPLSYTLSSTGQIYSSNSASEGLDRDTDANAAADAYWARRQCPYLPTLARGTWNQCG